MSTTYQELVCASDAVVDAWLARAGVSKPPVDPFIVAEAAGMDAQYDSGLDTRSAHAESPRGEGVVLIRPETSSVAASERECFACAHKLAESGAAAAIFAKAGLDSPSDQLREWTCNLVAGALLAPTQWFRQAWTDCRGDLLKVKRVFKTASHEVLARRLLTWETPTVITVIDNGRVSSRTGNCQHIDKMTPIEKRVAEQLDAGGRRRPNSVDLSDDPLRVTGWRVDAEGWERVILRLTVEA